MDIGPWLDEPHLRTLGRGLLVLGILLVVAMQLLGPVRLPEGTLEGTLLQGVRAPMLAIELPESRGDVETIVRVSGGECRMKYGLLLDLGIILLYGSVLAVLGTLLFRSPAPVAGRIGGAAAALAGVTAGLLDIVENIRIWKVLDGVGDEASLQALTSTSLWKWGLLAVAFLLLAGLFLLPSPIAKLLAGLSLVTGVVGLIGLNRHPLLEWTTVLVFLTLLVSLLVLAFWPGRAFPGSA